MPYNSGNFKNLLSIVLIICFEICCIDLTIQSIGISSALSIDRYKQCTVIAVDYQLSVINCEISLYYIFENLIYQTYDILNTVNSLQDYWTKSLIICINYFLQH